MKFGGSSLAQAERIQAVARIVEEQRTRRPVVVVSALAGVTDLLEQALDAARRGQRDEVDAIVADLERRHRWALSGSIEGSGRRHRVSLEIDRGFDDLRQRLRSIRVLGEVSPRARDSVLAVGEDLSARIVSAVFDDLGLPARRVDPRQIMATDDCFGSAEPELERVSEGCRQRLLPLLDAGQLPVLGGFVGASGRGDTTTLGRGGSDTSAAVIGLAMGGEEIQIWTDVDGLMSADPRLVPGARSLPRVSFAEAAELAHHGARVLHPNSIAPAVRERIPVRVLNSMRPDRPGTLIVGHGSSEAVTRPVAIASRSPVRVVQLTSRRMRPDPRLLPRVLESCSSAGVDPTFVLASDVAVTLVAEGELSAEELEQRLDGAVQVEIHEGRAMVCIVGSRLADPGPMRGRVLAALSAWQPELVAMGASRASIAAVLEATVLETALRQLHTEFLELKA